MTAESEFEIKSGTDSNGEEPGPSRKAKLTKTKGADVYRTKFSSAWIQQMYPFIHEVSGNEHSFHCTFCNRDVSCGHMGRHDVEWHVSKGMHQANVKAAKLQSTLSFQPVSSALTKKVIHAEVKVATLLVQCNIPLALADELTPLFRDVFSNSQIAKNYTSKCTKTACIVNGAIAPFFQQRLVELMRNEPFAVAIDGSSDTGIEKMNTLTVRVFDVTRQVVSTQFLDMCMSSSTAEGIFKMEDVLSKHGIMEKLLV